MFNKLFYQLTVIFFFAPTNVILSQSFTDSGQNLGDGRIFSIVLGDLNGDNNPDAFIANYLSYSTIWFNDGHGNFTDSGQRFGVPSE